MAALDDLVANLRAVVATLQSAANNAGQTSAAADHAVQAAARFGSERRVQEAEALRGTITEGQTALTTARQMFEELLQRAVALRAEQPVNAGSSAKTPAPTTAARPATGWDAPEVANHPKRPTTLTLTESRRKHILDGDPGGGGGHRHGTGRPLKTEFPKRWDDDTIISHVESVARSPDGTPDLQPNGKWIMHGVRDDVDVIAVAKPDGTIVTGYPRAGGRGVVENPGE